MSPEHQVVPGVYHGAPLGYHKIDGPGPGQCSTACARLRQGPALRSGSLLQLQPALSTLADQVALDQQVRMPEGYRAPSQLDQSASRVDPVPVPRLQVQDLAHVCRWEVGDTESLRLT